jgi:hypothetical protein
MDTVKLQITNPKLQSLGGAPYKDSKSQITNASPALFGISVIGIWNLFVIWNLWFGIFCFWS